MSQAQIKPEIIVNFGPDPGPTDNSSLDRYRLWIVKQQKLEMVSSPKNLIEKFNYFHQPNS